MRLVGRKLERVGLVAVALAMACGGGDETSTTSGSGSGAGGAGGGGGGGAAGADVTPVVLLPKSGLEASEIGVLVNDQDPQSVAVADYYRQARGLDESQIYRLSFPSGSEVLSEQDFAAAKSALDAMVDPAIEGYAITWTQPYRVACMSITAAFALGFDDKYCNTTGQSCGPTAAVPYYDASSLDPFTDHQLRPTMMIAGATTADAQAVIDNGVAADGSFPMGDGYLVRTTDGARSVRYGDFITTVSSWDYPEGLTLTYVDNSSGTGSNVIANETDVLFYFTGLAQVADIETNSYRPGAVADHLTSFGGRVPDSGQMSVARWLEAGVTASYGTVVEPCNYTAKFPNTTVLLPHYFRGETILEAYWKSVAWPGEGLFVGEPLARPWGSRVDVQPERITIDTTILEPGITYQVAAGSDRDGPFEEVVVDDVTIDRHQLATIVIEPADQPFYQLRKR